MCNKMIYPTIRFWMAKYACKSDDFDPPPEMTLGEIFENPQKDGFQGFRSLLIDLDIETIEKTASVETTIGELKKMIMESSDRHIAAALGRTPEQIRAARHRNAEIAKTAHAG